MKFSPDLLKVTDHCQYRSFITNRYTGARIAVDCGQCDYCIHKRAQKASMRVKTAGSAFKYSYFVTLTYDNEHIPLFNCKVLHSEYEDVVGISGDIHFGDEYHNYIPVSEYRCDDNSMLRHIFSNKFKALCRLTVRPRNMFLLGIIGFLVWTLFVALSLKRRPLIKRTIPFLRNTVVIILFPS